MSNPVVHNDYGRDLEGGMKIEEASAFQEAIVSLAVGHDERRGTNGHVPA